MVDFSADIAQCMEALLRGGSILYPTDTIWGIGCDALNEAAVEKIFGIKQRPKEKSLIVLLADAQELLHYVSSISAAIISVTESFDRPTTVVYEHATGLPDNVINADGSIAIRVTKDPFCKALIERLGHPLISTSANLSGQPSALVYAGIDKVIINSVDYVVKYRQDDRVAARPSRLVRMGADGKMVILRD